MPRIGQVQADPEFQELELMFRRGVFGRYTADLRFETTGSAADRRKSVLMPPIDLRDLETHDKDPMAYGVYLGAWLLGEQDVRAELQSALANATSLRLILAIADEVAELHRIRWEMTRDPATKKLLFVGENLIFSRYVSSADFRRVQRRAKSELRALIVVADPSNIGDYVENGQPLARVPVADEIARVRGALGNIPAKVLPADGKRASLKEMAAAMRAAHYDILYLVCHGAIAGRQPRLWLEKDDGTADVVEGTAFANRLTELRQRPSLVVLASCHSAGTGVPDAAAEAAEAAVETDGAFAALGPHLAHEGIPAVLAMQGKVTLKTVEQFMPVFFRELARDGQLDRAASVARGVITERPDAGVPVLSTRLKGGGIWYRLGWDSKQGFDTWPSVRQSIIDGNCTPILGPGLIENLHGSRRDIARRLAEKFHFPLAPQDRDELPQVAQYRSVAQDRRTIRSEYLREVCTQIQERYADVLDPKLLTPLGVNTTTEEIVKRCADLLDAAWNYRRANDANEPYRVLAGLPFTTIISTNVDGLFGRALREVPTRADPTKLKAPREDFFRWSPTLMTEHRLSKIAKKTVATEAAPLLYQLFGRLSIPESLVLTQDDYFDALITASREESLPQTVRSALNSKSLMFLGFNIDDWNFRVLFRFIVNLEGAQLLRANSHVAVQIDPEEQRFYDPRAARRYLERYFGEQRIEIFWGTIDDFIGELRAQFDDAPVGPPLVAAGAEQ